MESGGAVPRGIRPSFVLFQYPLSRKHYSTQLFHYSAGRKEGTVAADRPAHQSENGLIESPDHVEEHLSFHRAQITSPSEEFCKREYKLEQDDATGLL